MTQALTQIDGTFHNIGANGSEKDWDADTNRWTKGDNDRLYINDCKFVDYVALDSLIVLTNGSGVNATAEIDGDTLTLEITRDDGINHKEWTATFALPDDLAEDTDDEEDEDEDEELVTDGGTEQTSSEFTNDELEDAIESNAADTTAEDVRSALEMFQQSFEAVWNTHMDAIEDNALELVAMDNDVLVFADHTGHFWNEEFSHGPLGEQHGGGRMQSVVKQLHHQWARKHTDYSWSVDDPVVVQKPESFDAGQRLVEAVMLNLTSRGLTPREAWSVWGVIAGNSRNNWAARMGYDSHSGVSNAVRDAKQKLALPYL